MVNPSYRIIESFEITGRGLVVVVEETLDFLGAGRRLEVKITRPDDTVIEAIGFQEWLLRKQTAPAEKVVILLMGIEKSQVPIGSVLKIGGGDILSPAA